MTPQHTTPHLDVGAVAAGDLTCEASDTGYTRCRPANEAGVEGLDEGACVSLATGKWHAPGLPLHGTTADVRGHDQDSSGQAWAYVGPSRVVVPACVGRMPNPAETNQIREVSVGAREQNPAPRANPSGAIAALGPGSRPPGQPPAMQPHATPGQPTLYPQAMPGQPGLYPHATPGQPTLYPHATPGQPGLYPHATPGQPGLYPHATPGQPGLYPQATPGQPTLYPHATPGQPPTMYPHATPGQPTLYPQPVPQAPPSPYAPKYPRPFTPGAASSPVCWSESKRVLRAPGYWFDGQTGPVVFRGILPTGPLAGAEVVYVAVSTEQGYVRVSATVCDPKVHETPCGCRRVNPAQRSAVRAVPPRRKANPEPTLRKKNPEGTRKPHIQRQRSRTPAAYDIGQLKYQRLAGMR